MRWLLALASLGLAGVAVVTARRQGALPAFTLPDGWQLPGLDTIAGPAEIEQEQPRTNLFDDIVSTIDPTTYIPANVDQDTAARNVRAGLDTIAHSEGTYGRGDDGYNVLFGHGLFYSYADHPRQLIRFTDKKGRANMSSAAGRYQFLRATWDDVAGKLRLPDFSPASQDLAAIELIRRRGALRDLQAGRFATFIEKCRKEWASLPGANYDQPERPFSYLLAAYQSAGGTLEGHTA